MIDPPTRASAPRGVGEFSALDGLVDRHRGVPGGLLPLLHAVQDTYGYIPADAVPIIAKGLNLSRAEVHGVVTYYHFFRSRPAGRTVVQVCRAESCKALGADALYAHAERVLGCRRDRIQHGTRADGVVTLKAVYCLGLCAMSPNVMIDDRPYSRMTAEKLDRLAARLEIAA